ncbi:MAG TPA: hypothetical protein VN207_01025 [Ktedonobacteraceae bacterium]|nr:hypothetical protein [Ktedonobacteraceae bacterium]
MIWIAIAIAGAIIGAVALTAVGAYFWNKLGPSLTNWLHQHHLEKSHLTDVFIEVDKVMTGLRCRLFATKKRTSRPQIITQEIYRIEELPEDVRNQWDRVSAEQDSYREYVLQLTN